MENWVSVFTTTRELEAGIVKDLLDEAGIPAVILNQKGCFLPKLRLHQRDGQPG